MSSNTDREQLGINLARPQPNENEKKLKEKIDRLKEEVTRLETERDDFKNQADTRTMEASDLKSEQDALEEKLKKERDQLKQVVTRLEIVSDECEKQEETRTKAEKKFMEETDALKEEVCQLEKKMDDCKKQADASAKAASDLKLEQDAREKKLKEETDELKEKVTLLENQKVDFKNKADASAKTAGLLKSEKKASEKTAKESIERLKKERDGFKSEAENKHVHQNAAKQAREDLSASVAATKDLGTVALLAFRHVVDKPAAPTSKVQGKDLRPKRNKDKEYVCDYYVSEKAVCHYEYNLEPVFDEMNYRCTKIELVDTFLRTKNQIDNFLDFAYTVACRAFGESKDVEKTLLLQTTASSHPNPDDETWHTQIKEDYYQSKKGEVSVLKKEEVEKQMKYLEHPPEALTERQKVEKTYLPELYRKYRFEEIKQELAKKCGAVLDWEIKEVLHDREAIFFEGDVRKFLVILGRGLDFLDIPWGPYKICRSTRICVLKYL